MFPEFGSGMLMGFGNMSQQMVESEYMNIMFNNNSV